MSRLNHAARLVCLPLFLLVLSLQLARAQQPSTAEPAVAPAGLIAPDEPWAMPWYEIRGEEPGPTVVITGGIHGNEPAGVRAADQIRWWPVRRGRLIVVPRLNGLGLKANIRWFPPERNNTKLRDLNRNFPTRDNPTPRGPHATAVWEFVTKQKPDLVVDLHEGFDFHTTNPKSVGSSIICSPGERLHRLAALMQSAANSTTSDEKRFDILNGSGAVNGSLIRACAEQLRVDAFILETTFRNQPVSLRAKQHRTMVSALLNEIGMLDADCSSRIGPTASHRLVRVGLFDGPGTTAQGRRNLERVIDGDDGVLLTHFGPADIDDNLLDQLDVLVFPGGSGSKQGLAVGPNRRELVRGFIRDGGGVVGICAGAYLCSSHYKWSLHVINTAVYNRNEDIPGVGRRSMWFRGGPADVQIEFTAGGRDDLKPGSTEVVRYQNGPIVSPGPETELPAYKVLAWFRSEVSKYEPQKGTMVDTPAIVAAPFGSGRVLSVSPHPEATPALAHTIINGLRWAAGRRKHPQRER